MVYVEREHRSATSLRIPQKWLWDEVDNRVSSLQPSRVEPPMPVPRAAALGTPSKCQVAPTGAADTSIRSVEQYPRASGPPKPSASFLLGLAVPFDNVFWPSAPNLPSADCRCLPRSERYHSVHLPDARFRDDRPRQFFLN